jgi:hypothetical protein
MYQHKLSSSSSSHTKAQPALSTAVPAGMLAPLRLESSSSSSSGSSALTNRPAGL